jgi:XTP/dITP diphosphohydrolase
MAPRPLLLATGNRHKWREMTELLRPFGLEVVAPDRVGYACDVEETGSTFAENACLKAAAGLAATGLWTLADDSGIEAHALQGRPGVRSARFAGEPCDDAANNRALCAALAGHADRTVTYRCVIALARPAADLLTWEGSCAGVHIDAARGNGGFGYDPHVLLPQLGRTMAELSAEEKHAISHRGAAVRAFLAWLRLHPAP